MAKLDLGKVVGNDAGFGNVVAFVENDGGEPGVLVETDGDDRSKDFTFTFKNLSPDPLSSNEISQVIDSNQMLSTSSTLTGTGLSTLYQKLKEKFAALIHTHKASDITEGTFNIARIADNSIGTEKFTQSVRDSLSQQSDTGWVKPKPSMFGVRYRVKNGHLTILVGQKVSLGEQFNLFVLPEAYRPSEQVTVPASHGSLLCFIAVYENGNVNAIPITPDSTEKWLYGVLSFPI